MSPLHTALIETLGCHLVLSKSRLVTLAALMLGFVQSRTVNLSHLAVHLEGSARPASKYWRLQRFFQFIRLDQNVAAWLVVHMLNLTPPKDLALYRSNWKFGARDINVLMLAIVTRRFRIPLLFVILPHQGSSDMETRIALMRRYLALFPNMSSSSSSWSAEADRRFNSSPLGQKVVALHKQGSPSQRARSEFILRDPVYVATHGIEEVARNSMISASTISRYVRDLGLLGCGIPSGCRRNRARFDCAGN